LWEPNTSSDVPNLFLNPDGSSFRFDIYTKDVIDQEEIPILGPNIYQHILSDLDTWKNHEHIIADYTIAPYDWRLTLDDILNYGNQLPDGRLYYSGDNRATSTPYIIQQLRSLVASSRTGKVTIIAHSNGGLVAKALLKRLQNAHDPLLEKIDNLVMVDVPQTGTPEAIGALLQGFNQGLPKEIFPFILNDATARQFASTSPMAYHLLPSSGYFSSIGSTIITPPVTFSDGSLTQSFISVYGHAVTNYTELHNFLLGTEGRLQASTDDTQSPLIASPALLSYAETKHTDLDNWAPPASTTVYEIAGWGNDTLSSINYYTGKICILPTTSGFCLRYAPVLQYSPETVVDGDGTVITSSSLAMSISSPNVTRLWLNLRDYNTNLLNFLTFDSFSRAHADVFEVASLRELIRNNILTHSTAVLPQYLSATTPSFNSDDKRLLFRLHSPLALSVRDLQGHETSASTSTILGATYLRFGEVQYISVPANVSPTVHLSGISTGSFTLDVDQKSGDATVASTTFSGIPSATSTQASITFTDGTIANASLLAIDYNGDGATDISVKPQLGKIVTLPSPLTITADNKIVILHGVIPSLSATLSGFVNGDTATSSDVTGSTRCVTTATATSSIGTYPITCTVGTLVSSNYVFTTFIPGTLTITYRCDGFGGSDDHGKDNDDRADKTENKRSTPSIFKAGNNIPVSFTLLDFNGRSQKATTSPLWYIPSQGVSITKPANQSVFADPFGTTTPYKKDDDNQWKYTWNTKGVAPGFWYRTYAKLGNGQICSAVLGLKKDY
jgi:pimeloyl-ACP methyl ester carboxylesterase